MTIAQGQLWVSVCKISTATKFDCKKMKLPDRKKLKT